MIAWEILSSKMTHINVCIAFSVCMYALALSTQQQQREARWATSNYDWQSGISISSILNNIHLQISRLKLFYKAVHFSTDLKVPDYYDQETSIQSTRSYHPLHYSPPLINYNPSFFPRTIVDWNLLPTT